MAIRSTAARTLVLLTLALPLGATVAQDPVSRSVGTATAKVDPATGRLVPPTSEERRRLAEELLRMFDPGPDPAIERRPDGTRIVMLEGRNPTVMVLSLGQHGLPRLQCLTDDAAAAAWLDGLQSPATAPEAEPER